ncbi:hypothetical protein BDQ17DRAFT_454451 [Cyathus striatus]|nr:hypothetical protein BDQ17DRAFT_454451 [Cyathus striatus]
MLTFELEFCGLCTYRCRKSCFTRVIQVCSAAFYPVFLRSSSSGRMSHYATTPCYNHCLHTMCCSGFACDNKNDLSSTKGRNSGASIGRLGRKLVATPVPEQTSEGWAEVEYGTGLESRGTSAALFSTTNNAALQLHVMHAAVICVLTFGAMRSSQSPSLILILYLLDNSTSWRCLIVVLLADSCYNSAETSK